MKKYSFFIKNTFKRIINKKFIIADKYILFIKKWLLQNQEFAQAKSIFAGSTNQHVLRQRSHQERPMVFREGRDKPFQQKFFPQNPLTLPFQNAIPKQNNMALKA